MKSSSVDNGGSVSSFAHSLPPRPPMSPPSSSSTPMKIKRKKKDARSQRSEALTIGEQAFQLLAIAVVAGVVAKTGFKSVEWAQEQLKPFCDSASRVVDADNCIPCPPNGFCQDGRLECLAGFKRVGKNCAPDKEIDRTAQKLATAIKQHVCGEAARAACDGGTEPVWLPESEVLETLKNEGLDGYLGSDETFSLVWEKTASLAREEGIVIQQDVQGKEEFHCPGEVAQAYKSVGCHIKELLWENALTILLLSPVVRLKRLRVFEIVLVGSFAVRYNQRRKLNTRTEELYTQVCEALEEKALEARGDDGGDSWVVVSRLRDHLLSSRERKNVTLWKQVERMVQEDSRIDQYQKKVKGELKIVWEWQVEGAMRTPGSKKKLQRRATAETESPQGVSRVPAETNTSRFLQEAGSPLQQLNL
ncbi:hypothetical protein R1sor_002273 [Riccia sorocarpa]|uniref:Man1/Src1-like C-terminal domain-containing protein n=1 Tax=Riccia sorocarpa TaxID=122646 RepID=A0ABD3H2H5_9MARC